jgi:hypothetical protein
LLYELSAYLIIKFTGRDRPFDAMPVPHHDLRRDRWRVCYPLVWVRHRYVLDRLSVVPIDRDLGHDHRHLDHDSDRSKSVPL